MPLPMYIVYCLSFACHITELPTDTDMILNVQVFEKYIILQVTAKKSAPQSDLFASLFIS